MNPLGINQYPIRTIARHAEARAMARRERILFKRRLRRARHKATISAYAKRWREENREREADRKRRWEAANRERINARKRRWYALNRRAR